MSQVGFYHLTRCTADAALPTLLGRTLAAGERAVVRCGSAEHVAVLDRVLWSAVGPDWLPHGTARTGHAALQPIWITAEAECPNGAAFLFVLDGVTADLGAWRRVFDLFDGTDGLAVAEARRRWGAAKAEGHELTYWRQAAAGWVNGP